MFFSNVRSVPPKSLHTRKFTLSGTFQICFEWSLSRFMKSFFSHCLRESIVDKMEKWERSVGFVKLANWLIDWSFLLSLSSSFTIPLFPHTFTWVLLCSRFLAQDLQKHGPSSGRFRKTHYYSTWMTKLLNLSCAAVTEHLRQGHS